MKALLALFLFLVAYLPADTVRVAKALQLTKEPARYLVLMARVDAKGNTVSMGSVMLSSVSTTALTDACTAYAEKCKKPRESAKVQPSSNEVKTDPKVSVKF